MTSLKEWLEEARCGAVFEALEEEGADTPEDLLELDKADLDRLLAPLKKIPRKKLLKKIAALSGGDKVRISLALCPRLPDAGPRCSHRQSALSVGIGLRRARSE